MINKYIESFTLISNEGNTTYNKIVKYHCSPVRSREERMITPSVCQVVGKTVTFGGHSQERDFPKKYLAAFSKSLKV